MKKMRKMSKTTRSSFITYGMVILAFVILQILRGQGMLSSSLQSQLVPICAYVVMAVSLNLTVGVLGELSLGHAGFMSVGAFTGAVVATLSLIHISAAYPFATAPKSICAPSERMASVPFKVTFSGPTTCRTCEISSLDGTRYSSVVNPQSRDVYKRQVPLWPK